jgi:hypothetical protein
MDYHCYADDTQIYIVVKPRDNLSDMSMKLMSCLSETREWMCSNLLKLNQDKTELMIFAPTISWCTLSNCQLSWSLYLSKWSPILVATTFSMILDTKGRFDTGRWFLRLFISNPGFFECSWNRYSIRQTCNGTIKVITKLPNSEQSYKGKVQTHNYINRQNQSIN